MNEGPARVQPGDGWSAVQADHESRHEWREDIVREGDVDDARALNAEGMLQRQADAFRDHRASRDPPSFGEGESARQVIAVDVGRQDGFIEVGEVSVTRADQLVGGDRLLIVPENGCDKGEYVPRVVDISPRREGVGGPLPRQREVPATPRVPRRPGANGRGWTPAEDASGGRPWSVCQFVGDAPDRGHRDDSPFAFSRIDSCFSITPDVARVEGHDELIRLAIGLVGRPKSITEPGQLLGERLRILGRNPHAEGNRDDRVDHLVGQADECGRELAAREGQGDLVGRREAGRFRCDPERRRCRRVVLLEVPARVALLDESHEACLLEHPDVAGEVGWMDAEPRGDLCDGRGAVPQDVEDRHPRSMQVRRDLCFRLERSSGLTSHVTNVSIDANDRSRHRGSSGGGGIRRFGRLADFHQVADARPIEVGNQRLRCFLEAVRELGHESPSCLIACGLDRVGDRALDPLVVRGGKIQSLERADHVHRQAVEQPLDRSVAADRIKPAGKHSRESFMGDGRAGPGLFHQGWHLVPFHRRLTEA